ncbi:hypothetical protein [Sporosarcina aquimarina]|nr:hypothetical protein [Sporosarcina aquimarina]
MNDTFGKKLQQKLRPVFLTLIWEQVKKMQKILHKKQPYNFFNISME